MTPSHWKTVHDLPAREALPSEQAISREEEAILWRSLERIPEIYREPFILFYREHQSIEYVAAAVGIVRRRRQATAVARAQTVAGGSAGVRGKHFAPDGAGPGVFRRGACGIACRPGAAVGVGMAGKGAAAAKSGFLAAWLVPMYRYPFWHRGGLADCSGSSDRSRTAGPK